MFDTLKDNVFDTWQHNIMLCIFLVSKCGNYLWDLLLMNGIKLLIKYVIFVSEVVEFF